MKKSSITFCLLISLVLYYSFSSNPPNGRTGAPGENTCGSAGCHSPNNPNFAGSINITGLPADITLGQTYPLVITITDDVLLASRAGFQMTNVGPDQGASVGTFSNASSNAVITTSGIRTYVEHSPASSFSNGTVIYTVDWTAPNDLTDQDVIDFYGISVIANGSGTANDLVVTQQISATVDSPVATLAINLTNITDPLCSDSEDGSAEVNIIGGVPPYSIQWSSGESDPVALMLSDGGNSVTVTDAATSSEVIDFNLNAPSPIFIIPEEVFIIDVACIGENTGSINVSIYGGGTGELEFLWSNGETTDVIENLSANTYTLTISDENDCELITSYTVEDGADVSALINPLGSNCDEEMNITAIPFPAGIQYQYNWNTNETTPTINASAGILYEVTVTDINGCTASNSFSYEQNNGLEVNITVTGTGPYTLTAEASGGATTNYTYLWIETNETTASITVNDPGTYTVILSDQVCEISDSISIQNNCSLTIDSLLVSNPSCNGDNDGEIFIEAAFDMNSDLIQYEWSTGDNSQTLTNLSAGLYSVTISNPTCIDSFVVEVLEPEALILNVDIMQPTESNPNLGMINSTISNGTAPYEFAWSTGDTTSSIDNLGAGFYNLTVNDSNGCLAIIDSIELLLLECDITSAVNIDSIFCEDDLATATILTDIPLGLNPKYEWSTGDSTNNADSLIGGFYEVTITDALNCEDTLSFTILNYVMPSITVDSMTMITCDDTLAYIELNVDWLYEPYDILWSNGETGLIADSLEEGEISVIITNAKNCVTTDTFIIIKENPPSPVAIVENGTATLDEDGNFIGIPDIPFDLKGSCEDSLYLDLSALEANCEDIGTQVEYEVYFYNRTEILDTIDILVDVVDITPPVVEVELNFNFIEFCGFADTILVFENDQVFISDNCDTEIDSFFQIEIQSTSSEEICQLFTSSDASGNKTDFEICFDILIYSAPEMEAEVTDVACFMESTGCVEIETFGGTQPFTFTGGPTCDLPAGEYNFSVQDFNGCVDSISVEITEPTELVITLEEIQNEMPGESDGFIDVTVSGGVEPYEYAWTENGALVSSFEDLVNFPASQYDLTVTDANGCVSILNSFIDVFSSLENEESLQVKLIQNPVNQDVMLENLRIGSSIRFIGIDGRVLFHEDQVSSTAMSIDASNWIAGTYLCFVEHEGKKQLIKVIKG